MAEQSDVGCTHAGLVNTLNHVQRCNDGMPLKVISAASICSMPHPGAWSEPLQPCAYSHRTSSSPVTARAELR